MMSPEAPMMATPRTRRVVELLPIGPAIELRLGLCRRTLLCATKSCQSCRVGTMESGPNTLPHSRLKLNLPVCGRGPSRGLSRPGHHGRECSRSKEGDDAPKAMERAAVSGRPMMLNIVLAQWVYST